jgi:hypothetical protein
MLLTESSFDGTAGLAAEVKIWPRAERLLLGRFRAKRTLTFRTASAASCPG